MTESLAMADRSLLDIIDTPAFDDQTFLISLDHQGILGVEGPDAAKFLQGQVTCDVRELSDGVTRLGAQCNIKGRMMLSFRALQQSDQHIMLRMHPELIEKALTSLGKYIVFSKAKLHDRSSEFQGVGVYGPAAESLLRSTIGSAPDHIDEWCAVGNHIVIKLDHQRFECWLATSNAESIIAALSPHTVSAGHNLWTLLNIRAGVGEVRPTSYELFTPQALNFQLVNAINFRKGCYTGQEIVARLHYRGTLKRHMHRVIFSTDDRTLPTPGSSVNNSEGKVIGEIVMAAFSGDQRIEALANIPDEHLSDAYVGQKKLEHLGLPYAIPREENA